MLYRQYRRDIRIGSSRAAGEPLAERQPADEGGVGGRAAAGAAGGARHPPRRGAHLRLRRPLQGVAAAPSLARALTWVSPHHKHRPYLYRSLHIQLIARHLPANNKNKKG